MDRLLEWGTGCIGKGRGVILFLDDLEHVPDLKCIPDLERILDNKNGFLIFKQFPYLSITLQIVSIFLKTRSMRFFFWDRS